MLDLYTAATPNGHKVSIALEELALPYRVHPIDLGSGAQKQPAFLAMNPNGRIPVLVDPGTDPAADPATSEFVVFESGAILVYLAELTGRLLPPERKARSRVMQWLMFQMGGVGPMMGQANVFFRYFPDKIPAVIERYQNESRRLLGVLDGQLARGEWLAGDYSIADIATFPWARAHAWGGISIEGLPHLARWLAAIEARPAVQRGLLVPTTAPTTEDDQVKVAAALLQR